MIVLDTHVLIWMAGEPQRLSRAAHRAIQQARANDEVAIASISLLELAFLAERSRIKIAGSVESFVRDITALVATLEITPVIACLAVQLPSSFPRDPADRLIAATAIDRGASLVTADDAIRRSRAVQTVW